MTGEKQTMDCLIGYTGFVGGNLLAQRPYDVLINSKNFRTMVNQSFDRVVCAGVSAVKWQANKNPEQDLERINELIEVLKTVKAKKFILISTIDVYSVSSGVDEDHDCHNPAHHAYGRHRLYFEDFCREQFEDLLIVRLPGLFGNGIKKNVIFDLLNDNCLDMINPDSAFQYYDLANLSDDIEWAEKQGIRLLNLFTEPVATRDIIDRFFPGKKVGGNTSAPVFYDMHTKYAPLRGKKEGYLYSAQEVLEQLQKFIENYKK